MEQFESMLQEFNITSDFKLGLNKALIDRSKSEPTLTVTDKNIIDCGVPIIRDQLKNQRQFETSPKNKKTEQKRLFEIDKTPTGLIGDLKRELSTNISAMKNVKCLRKAFSTLKLILIKHGDSVDGDFRKKLKIAKKSIFKRRKEILSDKKKSTSKNVRLKLIKDLKSELIDLFGLHSC